MSAHFVKMLKTVFGWLKPVAAAIIILAVLQATGLLSSVSVFTQTAMLKIGIRNADAIVMRKPEPFDYKFVLRNTAGERLNFDQYKGKVIFLNLWATWCGPCRAEMPTIQSLYEKMDTTGVVFVILSVDKDSDEPKIASYLGKYKYTFPVYRPSGYLTSQLNVPGIPTTFIINKEGKIVSKEVGATNFDTAKFRKFLLSLDGQ
ncbi:MAG TPA: TlpA disulfide reductase family protein [Cyclobacteriaceae bacterium]|nr:TlpA disulfide reductase family protein [Cyclobacteriaceae bacterium]